jgi:hypothetical protein
VRESLIERFFSGREFVTGLFVGRELADERYDGADIYDDVLVNVFCSERNVPSRVACRMVAPFEIAVTICVLQERFTCALDYAAKS